MKILTPSVLLGYIYGLFIIVRGAYGLIDNSLYAKLVRYTRFAAAAYADNCPHPPENATVIAYITDPTTDTQATLFRDDKNQDLIVSFRGTSTIVDLATDYNAALVSFNAAGVDCKNCTVHAGYYTQWNSISSAVISNLTTALVERPTYNVTVTGHSMGGSLAAIASAAIQANLSDSEKLTTYTYGQPRTGNPAFADYMDNILALRGRLYRVTHTNDGVPQAVTTASGYHHHRAEYWVTNPPIPANVRKCEGQEPKDCNNSEPGTGFAGSINVAHLNYFGISLADPWDKGASSCSGWV